MSPRRDRLQQLNDAMTAPKTARAVEQLLAWVEGSEPTPASADEDDRPTAREIRQELTRKATLARTAGKQKNIERARQLKGEGLSPAQIAVKMTSERDDPQRAPIDPRTVRGWLAIAET